MTKNEIQYYASLNKKKFRESEALFLIEGKRIVDEGINSDFHAEIIFYTDAFLLRNSELITHYNSLNIKTEKIDDRSFQKITDTKNPQGIAAVFHKRDFNINMLGSSNFIVALENISDPGNFGTILRTCAWFGFEELIISSDSVDLYNPKVLRSSMGAIFNLQIFQTEKFYEILSNFKNEGYLIIVADTEGENIFEYKPGKKSIITFCNEANGASAQLKELSVKNLSIHKIGSGESLNVASAAAVIISQISKNNNSFRKQKIIQ